MPLTSTSKLRKPYHILVVEDSETERFQLMSLLTTMGYQVKDVTSAEEAISYLEHHQIDMVITDWMMPGLSGLELCKMIKANSVVPYTILLTGNKRNEDIIEGISAGADDFICKPFNIGVLKVRVLAGIRIIEMQNELAEKNEALNQLLSQEKHYLEALKQDLATAAQLQQALLPQDPCLANNWQVATAFKPAQDLAGDLFQCFHISPKLIGFYLLDVSGHGTAASMLSFTIAHHLSHTQPAWQEGDIRHLVNKVNLEFDDPEQTGRFATLLLGVANTETGLVELINAGHPAPIVLAEDGAEFIDDKLIHSQLPIGLDKHYQYQSRQFILKSGAQLLLYSDGIYECRHSKFGSFGQNKLLKNINDARNLTAEKLLHYLSYSALLWQEKKAQDDISLMLISRGHPCNVNEATQ
ncbi:SpoIIE family protein phosphatase [Shewanella marinintestina]|uniref:PP2C family protein-serine/threonine phosphatase n=1 Tax=Shewanella marinintestina TaxID=190305 RepID=UPI00201073B1|nr:SpoIIE family protein phosphatase [Shewanella marinintestina]MCL1145186.1 SpoIIE family protein phosphatase [Shewanella marinintestina]